MENTNDTNRPGLTPEPAADGIREVSRRLYELADNLGDGIAGAEAESIARAVSRIEDATERLTAVEAALASVAEQEEWDASTLSDFVDELRAILKGGNR